MSVGEVLPVKHGKMHGFLIGALLLFLAGGMLAVVVVGVAVAFGAGILYSLALGCFVFVVYVAFRIRKEINNFTKRQ